MAVCGYKGIDARFVIGYIYAHRRAGQVPSKEPTIAQLAERGTVIGSSDQWLSLGRWFNSGWSDLFFCGVCFWFVRLDEKKEKKVVIQGLEPWAVALLAPRSTD